VYLGGGIAPAILPALRRGEFLSAFLDKGRMRNLLSRVPVMVILDCDAPLLGAAWFAASGGVIARPPDPRTRPDSGKTSRDIIPSSVTEEG
jgi:hypothetical protein